MSNAHTMLIQKEFSLEHFGYARIYLVRILLLQAIHQWNEIDRKAELYLVMNNIL
jgi:hypothetical protein